MENKTRTLETVDEKDLCYVKVTSNYVIDEFGRITVFKNDTKIRIQNIIESSIVCCHRVFRPGDFFLYFSTYNQYEINFNCILWR